MPYHLATPHLFAETGFEPATDHDYEPCELPDCSTPHYLVGEGLEPPTFRLSSE